MPENTLNFSDAIGSGSCVTPSIAFRLEKSTRSKDEVDVHASFPSACLVEASGFTNASLGFSSTAALSANPPNPVPTITAAILSTLNPGLSAAQIAASPAANLPSVNSYGPPPVLATDPTLDTDFQTFLYPFTVSFPNENAFGALDLHQAAVVTLTATFPVGSVPPAQADIELSKGEDPFFTDLTPSNPLEYPPWLSFDLRFFKATPNQTHQMFSVANPADASDAIRTSAPC